MATKTISLPVGEDFNLERMVEDVSELYRSKAYNIVVSPIASETSMQLSIEKDNEGIKNYVGMGIVEKVSFNVMETKKGAVINVSFDDECLTMRLIALGVGWFLCLVPFITGIIGFMNHSNFLKQLQTDVAMLAQKA